MHSPQKTVTPKAGLHRAGAGSFELARRMHRAGRTGFRVLEWSRSLEVFRLSGLLTLNPKP